MLQKYGVEQEEVTRALLSGDPSDQLAIAYQVLVDNKMMAESKYPSNLMSLQLIKSQSPY